MSDKAGANNNNATGTDFAADPQTKSPFLRPLRWTSKSPNIGFKDLLINLKPLI